MAKNQQVSTMIRSIILAGLFIALGAIFPQIFHFIGGQAVGRMLLPMLFPILISGFFLPKWYALAVGILTPLASHLITGGTMPPLFPNMAVMMVEFGLIAFLVSALPIKNPFEKLIISLAIGKLTTLLLGFALASASAALIPIQTFVVTQLVGGPMLPTGSLPGLMWQIIAVPLIVKVLQTYIKRGGLNEN